MRLISVLRSFSLLLILSSSASAASLIHSEMKTYTGPECGTYFESTSRLECGVEEYDSCQSATCSDSYPSENWVESGEFQCSSSPCDLTERSQRVNEICGNRKGGQIDKSNPWGSGSWTPKPDRTAYKLSCTRSEFQGSCKNSSCRVLKYKSCEDPLKERNKTCQIRKTATEISAYIDANAANIPLLSQQLATAQGNYIFGSKQSKLASCFIQRYIGDILYEDIVPELKSNYSAMFGLEFDASKFDCNNADEKIEYTFQSKTCQNISVAEVSAKLTLPTLSTNERYFYELCQQRLNADSIAEWFKFQANESDLLLNDLIARSNANIADKLATFRANLKKVDNELNKCTNCRVINVEVSKPNQQVPDVLPVIPSTQENIDVIYNGESHAFSAGQGWDLTQSTVEESQANPASGQNHIRATLNNVNSWGAAAYVVNNWAAKDFQIYNTIRLKAKSDKATRLKIFFVSMDNNLESRHLEFNISSAYQSFEFDLKSAVTPDYDLSQVQAIIIAVSQPGKNTYLIDLDDIEMIRSSN